MVAVNMTVWERKWEGRGGEGWRWEKKGREERGVVGREEEGERKGGREGRREDGGRERGMEGRERGGKGKGGEGRGREWDMGYESMYRRGERERKAEMSILQVKSCHTPQCTYCTVCPPTSPPHPSLYQPWLASPVYIGALSNQCFLAV